MAEIISGLCLSMTVVLEQALAPVQEPDTFFEGEAELQICQTLCLFAQQTFTGRRTAAWNEPSSLLVHVGK